MKNQSPKCIAADIDGIHWQLLDSEGKQVQVGSSHRTKFGRLLKVVVEGRPPTSFDSLGSIHTLDQAKYEPLTFGFKWVKQNKG